MKIIKFKLKSLCPLLMDRFVDIPCKTTEDYKKAAEKKVYRDEKGYLAIEAKAIKAVIREAASDLGKKTEARKRRDEIKACLFVSPPFLSMKKKDFDGIAEHIVTRGKGEKVTRVITYRPQINEWEVEGIIEITGSLTPEFVKQALEYGGIRKGLYGFRPEYGRFEVIKWEVKDGR